MFLLMLRQSFVRGWRRKALATATIVLAASLITALMNVSIDVGDKMAKELKSYGANIHVTPKSEGISLEIGGDDYNPLEGQFFIEEADLPRIKDIFWQNNIVGFAPFLKATASIAGREKKPLPLIGTTFDKPVAVAGDEGFRTGVRVVNPYWQVEGKWIVVDFDDNSCMIGKTLAKNMELKLGDAVNVIRNETGFQRTLKIKGIVETGQVEDEQIFVNLDLAGRVLEREGKVNHAMVSIVNDGIDIDRLAAQMEGRFPGLDAKPLHKVSYADGRILEKIRGLTKKFGSVIPLDGVDMQVRQGEWVAIMGPSGSGKTTMLNLLACLDTPTAGQYILDGADTSILSERERVVMRREKIGLVFQQFHLVPYLTALENVMLAQYYHSMVDRGEAGEVLERVGLGHRTGHLPSQLSGGEQQRVCIARALINQPAIILADEPTGNLDEANEEIILDFLKELHREGRTIVLVTHNPELAEFSDRVIRLNHGRGA